MNGAIFFGIAIGAGATGLSALGAFLHLFRRVRSTEGDLIRLRSDYWELRGQITESECKARQGFEELGLEWQIRTPAKWAKK